ncbi:MAG TPA: DedA family protein [Epsilonproteobacteria bacterium]|nr:DedA family protein [Campylobacterota bacterium]
MSLAYLVTTYGYPAIIIGTFFEGETILVLGGIAAHHGYLELQWVILAAFIGAVLGDQLYFFIGHKAGEEFLDKRPQWKKKVEKIFSLLHKHKVWLILGFRFLYGIRTVAPFAMGSSKIPYKLFIPLNIIGGLIWASTFGYLGYLFGNALEEILGDIKKYELSIFIILGIAGVLFWFYRIRKKQG